MSEFLTTTFEIIAVFSLHGILNSTGNGIIDTENGALDQFDFPGGITAQIAGRLSLTPGLRGGGLTAGIGGRNPTGNTKASGGIFHVAAVVILSLGMVGYVGFCQAVSGGGSDRRATAVVVLGVIKGAAEWALVLVEERLGGIVFGGKIILLERFKG